MNYLKVRKSNLKFFDLLDPNLDEKCIWLLDPVSFYEILIKTCSAVKNFWKGLNEHKSCPVVNWGFFHIFFPRFPSLKSSKQFEISLQWRLYEICASRKCANFRTRTCQVVISVWYSNLMPYVAYYGYCSIFPIMNRRWQFCRHVLFLQLLLHI